MSPPHHRETALALASLLTALDGGEVTFRSGQELEAYRRALDAARHLIAREAAATLLAELDGRPGPVSPTELEFTREGLAEIVRELAVLDPDRFDFGGVLFFWAGMAWTEPVQLEWSGVQPLVGIVVREAVLARGWHYDLEEHPGQCDVRVTWAAGRTSAARAATPSLAFAVAYRDALRQEHRRAGKRGIDTAGPRRGVRDSN